MCNTCVATISDEVSFTTRNDLDSITEEGDDLFDIEADEDELSSD